MGSNICSPQISELDTQYQPLSFTYGEDQFYAKIIHEDRITCKAPELQKILEDCQERLKISERLYKDPSMNTDPIILRSLGKDKQEVKCTFQRPHVFLNDPSDPLRAKYKKYKIVDVADSRPSQIVIRDQVMQSFGMLLCFLAERPQLINTIILTEPNSYGICALQMNVQSKREFIYIDDYILCSDKTPLFAQPIRGIYMWPCLLEKAWFKVKGYMNRKIEKKSPVQIIKNFLSYPIKTFSFASSKVESQSYKSYNQALLKKYLHNQQEDRSIFVTSRAQPPHKIGISGNKHFYLLKVLTFEGNKLYYMRNPYTSFDFRGSYRILPEELATLIKKETGDLKIHEGNFVLDEQEFLQQIQSFSIIYFHKSSQVISEQPISLATQEFYLTMDLKQDGLTSVAFYQASLSKQEKKYLPLSFHLISLNDNELVSEHQNDGACFGQQSTMFFQNVYKPLKAGHYLIRLKKKLIDNKSLRKHDSTDKIVATSSAKIKFDYKQLELCKKHFKTFLLELGRKKMQHKKNYQKQLLTNSGIEYVVFWLADIGVIYFQKTNLNKKEIRVEVKFQKMSNLQCLTHQIGSNYLALQPIADNQSFQKLPTWEHSLWSPTDLLQRYILPIYSAFSRNRLKLEFQSETMLLNKTNKRSSGTFFDNQIMEKHTKINQQKLISQKQAKIMLELSHCYKILRLEQDCSDLQLRQKYRKIALELHPDKQKFQDSDSQKENTFMKVNQAYKQITNHRKQKNANKKFKSCDNQYNNDKQVKLMSFEEIRKKISDLNKIICETTPQINYSSKVTKQIDNVYEQHFKIMQKMSEKLRLMRQK